MTSALARSAEVGPVRSDADRRPGANLDLAMWVLIYGALFHWSFTTFTSPQFTYARFSYEDPSVARLVLSYLAVALPLIRYDRCCIRPANYLISVIYVVLYVPAMLGIAFMWRGSGTDLTVVQLSLMLSVLVLFDVAKLKPPGLAMASSGLPPKAFDFIVAALTIVNIVAITYTIGGNFQLVAFSDVYEQRFRNAPLIQSSALGYLFSWQTTFFTPYLIGVGLAKKKWILVAIALTGSVVMYGAFADKAALLIPLLIVILRRGNAKAFLKSILAVSSAAILFAITVPASGGLISLKSLVLVRTLSVPGFTMSRYYDYFDANGYTYWSHIRPISGVFTTYPYGDNSLGQLIGIELSGSSLANWNANFWASDGIAAFGPTGIMVLLPFLCLLLVSINYLAQGMDTKFFTTLLTGFMISISNVPLSTSLLTGGLIWIIIMRFSQPVFIKVGWSRMENPAAAPQSSSRPGFGSGTR